MNKKTLLYILAVLITIVFNKHIFAFEEIGPPTKPMDFSHVWKPQEVGQKFRFRNNIKGTEGYVEFIEVTETIRTIRVGSSTCVQTCSVVSICTDDQIRRLWSKTEIVQGGKSFG